MQIRGYGNNTSYDELFSSGKARSGLGELSKFLKSKALAELNALRHDTELTIRSLGISFTVYSEGQNIDREWPFDSIPRTIMREEWEHIEKGSLSTFVLLMPLSTILITTVRFSKIKWYLRNCSKLLKITGQSVKG